MRDAGACSHSRGAGEVMTSGREQRDEASYIVCTDRSSCMYCDGVVAGGLCVQKHIHIGSCGAVRCMLVLVVGQR